ncbi:MAG: DUF2029 domain-containing protein [Candidatus Omnitrophica bacterium]|nr:DUF2029 domain-containing protein [Candidatus Omnitrophota bacterium]
MTLDSFKKFSIKRYHFIYFFFFSLTLSYIYSNYTISASTKSFIKLKENYTLNDKKLKIEYCLEKEGYFLRIKHSLNVNFLKKFYFNNEEIFPIKISKRKKVGLDVSYIFLPKNKVKEGVNLLEIDFEKSYPQEVQIRLSNYYYSFYDSIYLLFSDSSHLESGKKKISVGLTIIFFLSFLLNFFLLTFYKTKLLRRIILWGTGTFFLFFLLIIIYNKLSNLSKIVIPKIVFWEGYFIFIFLVNAFIILSLIIIRNDKFATDLKEKRIKFVGNIILWGFIVSFLYHIIKSIFLGWRYPHNIFLFLPHDRFNDFFHFIRCVRNLDPYAIDSYTYYLDKQPYWSTYFPFANILFYFMGFFSPLCSLVLWLGIFIILFLWSNSQYLSLNNKAEYYKYLFIYSFLTYPFLFSIDRANLEMYLYLFLFLFIFFYQKHKLFWSAFFLSLATALKGYPVIFLILLFSERKYKSLLTTCVIIILITSLSLLLFKGGFWNNLKFVLSGFHYKNAVLEDNNLIIKGVSLFCLIKMYFIIANKITLFSKSMNMYFLFAILFSLLLFFFIVFIERELWRKVMLLVSIMLLFPQISGDYKLLHIFLPMFLFFSTEKKNRFEIFYLICFGLLLIPKDYYLFKSFISDSGYSDISIGMILNILILILFILLIVIDGIIIKLKSEKRVI